MPSKSEDLTGFQKENKMKSFYVEFQEQTDARIKLALSQQRKGFYAFAESTILQAHDAVDRFESRLDGLENMPYLLNDIFCNPEKFIEADKLTKKFSEASRNNLGCIIEEMERIRKENALLSFW